MSEKASQWSTYPHEDYARQIDEIYVHGARLDAWRGFLQPQILEALHKVGAEISIESYGVRAGYVHFSADTTEATARQIIDGIMRGYGHEEYVFQRERLNDPRAFARLPLSLFVVADPRVAPLSVSFSVHQHWQLLMEHFAFGKRQKNHIRYDTLIFRHPQVRNYCGNIEHEVVAIETEKGKPVAARREALLRDAESNTESWKFSILERWTLRHLNNEPQPGDEPPW